VSDLAPTDGVVTLRPSSADGATEQARRAVYAVEHDGQQVGTVELLRTGPAEGELSWRLDPGHRGLGYATRAVRLLVEHAVGPLGLRRVQARVEPGNVPAVRVASRAGLRREGLLRVQPGDGEDPDATEYVLLARLASDPPLDRPETFRAMLNAGLPRKRAIAQMLVRDAQDRVLVCRLTYKNDWDLPGGVVEVNESPREAVSREVEEELGLEVPAGPLVLTDWLPPWSGWDDALCLVFDGGVHDASILDGAVLQAREIRSAQFCTPEEVREHCADFTARRVESALAALSGPGRPGPAYTESGRQVESR
jgi:8-oxo-dGTP pyrophosphatase MutT (NUDIX family)